MTTLPSLPSRQCPLSTLAQVEEKAYLCLAKLKSHDTYI